MKEEIAEYWCKKFFHQDDPEGRHYYSITIFFGKLFEKLPYDICCDERFSNMFINDVSQYFTDFEQAYLLWDQIDLIYLYKYVVKTNANKQYVSKILEKFSIKDIDEYWPCTTIENIISQFPNEIENDDDKLREWCILILNENPKVIDDFKSGNKNSINRLIGNVMKLSKGKAAANKVKEILIEEISK